MRVVTQLMGWVLPWCCGTLSWQCSRRSLEAPCTHLCPRTPGNSKIDDRVKADLCFQVHAPVKKVSFYLFVCFGVGHAYSSELGTSVSQGAFPAAETRSGVYTRDARKAGIKLALSRTKEKSRRCHWRPLLTAKFSAGGESSVPTSSTSSQSTPSPVNPSGQGAHWKPPDS